MEKIKDKVDVLWGIPDNIVYSPRTSRSILLFTFKNKLPLIGISAPWVQSGALYALERDYSDIGIQCGEMAVKSLSGMAPESIPAEHPRRVVYHLNMKTAKHMGVVFEEELTKKADKLY